jgi:hypothetical protein
MKFHLNLFLGCLLMQTGCVGVVPVPSFSRQPASGHIIKPCDVAFIVPGQTSRAAVVERLGTAFHPVPRMPAFAYSWELRGHKAIWWWFVAVPDAAAGDLGEFDWNWRAFFVAYDEHGVVTKTEFVRLSSNKSLDEQLEKWVKRSHPTPHPAHRPNQEPKGIGGSIKAS